jgi:hypothetical protein
MGSPNVGGDLRGLAGACGFKQNIPQPRCIASLKVERLAKYSSLYRPCGCKGAQAIVLDLAEIEIRPIAVWQSCRHAGTRISH